MSRIPLSKECKELFIEYKNVCKIISTPNIIKKNIYRSPMNLLQYQQKLVTVKSKFELCVDLRMKFKPCALDVDYGHLNIIAETLENIKEYLDEIIRVEKLLIPHI